MKSTDDRVTHALTIRRPWSDAIAVGKKDIENRTWCPPIARVGTRIAIHAGNGWVADAEVARGYRMPERDDTPMGLVATARLVGALDCRGRRPIVIAPANASKRDLRRIEAARESAWWFGPVGWVLADVVRFAKPIACKGRLSVWELTASQRRSVAAKER